MQEHDMSWVRTEMALAQPAPPSERGLYAWVRKNLIATPGDTILTILGILIVAWILPQVINWALLSAQWTGSDRTVCATVSQGGIQPDGWSGACWAFVNAKFGQFMFGRYPIEERWRPILVAILFVALLVPMLIPRVPRKGLNAILLFLVLPIVSFFLLLGGVFGLPHVETSLWGGLLVTLSLSFVGIAVSLPLGTVLALGRRSKMPIIKMLCVIFIETVRGIPLITVLFFVSVMLPLFLPEGVTFDKFLRALIGVSLFAAAYMAEVVRGGLQAIPKGQYEGADSLGLGYWQKMGLIVLPQALKLVIPGIVNTFIGMFKDTSLVLIISMFDLLGVVKQNFSDANWATPQTAKSGLVFAAFVFWLFCFGMSRYSMYTERRLDTGYKR
ncbi:MAG: ABC transporter permease subunit [Mesorhizobium sp.]|uniref:amino acid ABC transporter permease n=1 Tax=unclassified Mesorhizobium TaxID=325217 RepID=UPI000F752E5A|nr:MULTISPECIES: amino acid ABC transporter permease [unclassified Mesorhizobium]AZO47702.1 amino acid ABC transporter permease [Mesorhizobium sp. M4B.F.Ca.ET.058.02.1.1]RUX47869.1 ABC transporter permease subunit [Mesorhizobium sp. M4A.F.Ca.ET.050.02.1.1]RVC46713.1 ABC transporter permease subunit [Mesorhizobium sp. M4A.F.Ca.ET.090.04.2.1]RVC79335.1 ABC transporter permease subunit [Mesorhizobium sp. M4A.F.Ca.ET.022.05.2.1]RVD44349.1 ABC transporter permease subunit [Mesorhizobium sp. M4A.F.C